MRILLTKKYLHLIVNTLLLISLHLQKEAKQHNLLQEILEVVIFIKDNAVSKDEFQEFRKEVNTKFKKIDERFEKVDERFDQIDKRFEKVDERFDQIDKRFEKVDEKFRQTENTIIHHVDGLIKLHTNLESKVRKLALRKN